jgi:hypothetical protein
MTTNSPASSGKRKLGCWTILLFVLGIAIVGGTIKTLVAPDRQFGSVPAPVVGATIHWYERKNDDYVLQERRVITRVDSGYVTMTRPSGEVLTVPRVKYDEDARK